MALLNILHYPNKRLNTIAKPIIAFDKELHTHIENMFETMYQAKGIGLASTQVDDHRQVVVIDLSEQKNERRVLINPEILAKDGETIFQEGCLSVPGIFEHVTRAEWIKVRAQDQDGQPFELEADGLLSICIQHEIDHLNGKVFIEYLSRLKQSRIRTKLRKQEHEYQTAECRMSK